MTDEDDPGESPNDEREETPDDGTPSGGGAPDPDDGGGTVGAPDDDEGDDDHDLREETARLHAETETLEEETDRLREELADLREELDGFEEDVERRTVEKDLVERELRRYVRKRMRRGHARGWGPYLVLLYGTAMTVVAFLSPYFTDFWAIVAMIVVWLSTLGLYVVTVVVGLGFNLLDVPGRARDFVGRLRDDRFIRNFKLRRSED